MIDIDGSDRSAGRGRGGGVLAFTLLTFALSWTAWFAASALWPLGGQLAYLPGVLMPGFVALWLSYRHSERSCRELVGRVFKWRVSLWYYLFALTFMALVKVTAAALYRLDTGQWPSFGEISLFLMLISILLSTPIQAGEEIGWRGYMLERLARRSGFAWASLVVGVVWATWHLPMFLWRGGNMVGQSFAFFVLLVTALSVAVTWLYSKSAGSLLLPMIMHAAINNTAGIVPSRTSPDPEHTFSLVASPMGWLTVIVLWAVAVVLLVSLWRAVPRPSRSASANAGPDNIASKKW